MTSSHVCGLFVGLVVLYVGLVLVLYVGLLVLYVPPLLDLFESEPGLCSDGRQPLRRSETSWYFS